MCRGWCSGGIGVADVLAAFELICDNFRGCLRCTLPRFLKWLNLTLLLMVLVGLHRFQGVTLVLGILLPPRPPYAAPPQPYTLCEGPVPIQAARLSSI